MMLMYYHQVTSHNPLEHVDAAHFRLATTAVIQWTKQIAKFRESLK